MRSGASSPAESSPPSGERSARTTLLGTVLVGNTLLLAALVAGHPAARGELGELARLHSAVITRPWELVGQSVSVAPGIVVAIAALFLGVSYIAAFVVAWLARPPGPAGTTDDGPREETPSLALVALLGVALASHAAGTVVVTIGGAAGGFYGSMLAVAFLHLLVVRRRFGRTSSTAAGVAGVAGSEGGRRPRPPLVRVAAAAGAGVLLMMTASVVDQALPVLFAAPILPDVSFVVGEAARTLVHGRMPQFAHAASVVSFVACAALLPRLALADNAPPSVLRALALAPVLALLFAPSNPVRAIAFAWTLDRLRALGVGPVGLGWFIAAAIAAFALTPALG